jgi:hypothetical protein
MIALEDDEIEDSDVYESEDGEADGLHAAEEFAGVTRANYVDRVRFSRVPSEDRPVVKGESAPSTDPLYVYYRSMSKIPLLTREEEVYLDQFCPPHGAWSGFAACIHGPCPGCSERRRTGS